MTLASYRARSSHKNKVLSHELKSQNIYTKIERLISETWAHIQHKWRVYRCGTSAHQKYSCTNYDVTKYLYSINIIRYLFGFNYKFRMRPKFLSNICFLGKQFTIKLVIHVPIISKIQYLIYTTFYCSDVRLRGVQKTQ